MADAHVIIHLVVSCPSGPETPRRLEIWVKFMVEEQSTYPFRYIDITGIYFEIKDLLTEIGSL